MYADFLQLVAPDQTRHYEFRRTRNVQEHVGTLFCSLNCNGQRGYIFYMPCRFSRPKRRHSTRCTVARLESQGSSLGDTADRTIAIAEPAGDAEGITRICTTCCAEHIAHRRASRHFPRGCCTCGALVREHHERAYQTKPSYKLSRLGVHRAVQEIEHFAACNDEMNDVLKKRNTTMLSAIARGDHERSWD